MTKFYSQDIKPIFHKDIFFFYRSLLKHFDFPYSLGAFICKSFHWHITTMLHTNLDCISINGFSVSPLQPMLINIRPSFLRIEVTETPGYFLFFFFSFYNKSENLQVILLLHRKQNSISIAVS